MSEAGRVLCVDLFNLFDEHMQTTANARKRRREELALKGSIEAIELEAAADLANGVGTGAVGGSSAADADAYGTRLLTDDFDGDSHLRTLNSLLREVDRRGFERYAM